MVNGVLRLAVFGLAVCLGFAPAAGASPLDFTVTSKGSGGPAVLIIGGIQGDEPGGFSAAALLATHYTFTRGTVHVVPNLNFPAIIQRSRGLHGDMNRKFAELSAKDPEFETVRRIQTIIASPHINLVLNLHDGSGFYRPTHETSMRNPNRWGQSVIIDQDIWPGVPFGELSQIAETVASDANKALLEPDHSFHVRNTRTMATADEMSQCLTWFALNHDKAAFGLEVSKEFGVSQRTYYHLHMVESFFRQAGVEFERDFPLTIDGITGALGNDVYIGFVNNRLVLPLDNARPRLAGSLPLPRGAEKSINANMPIVAVTTGRDTLNIHYGNNTVTSFKPDWLETDDGLDGVHVSVDGETREVRFGDTVHVGKEFLVHPETGYRVRAIGTNRGVDESNMLIRRRDFLDRYSIDKAGTTYRVEVYNGKRYAGTFLVRFGTPVMAVTTPLPATLPAIAGQESDLGW